MKMSEKKRKAVYNAIAGSIMDLRVELNKPDSAIGVLSIDAELFKLELKIWKKVKDELNIDGV